MAEYVGKNSCAAKREGWYIERKPSSLSYWAALIWASFRDYQRRYKYDDTEGCKRVYCGKTCLEQKLLFIRNMLAPRYLSGTKLRKVVKWVDYVLEHGRLPAEVRSLYRAAIKRVSRRR